MIYFPMFLGYFFVFSIHVMGEKSNAKIYFEKYTEKEF